MERLIRAGDGLVLAHSVERAETWTTRIEGLMGRSSLPPGGALLLKPARQIHTFGMRFPIDVVFCDHRARVVHVVHAMQPGRVGRLVWRASFAFELEDGAARRVTEGDRLLLTPANGRSDRSRREGSPAGSPR